MSSVNRGLDDREPAFRGQFGRPGFGADWTGASSQVRRRVWRKSSGEGPDAVPSSRPTTRREDAMGRTRIIFALLVLAWTAGTATAQQDKSLRERIVGTWDFVVAEVTAPNGKKSFPFGETPKGLLIFTADGRFSQIHVASDLPKLASNNRLTGTPEEYAAIMQRSISVFGTYAVDEAKKTVT